MGLYIIPYMLMVIYLPLKFVFSSQKKHPIIIECF
nr:MAG TPA: hypothetical protein [Caudoviricetes sp.]